MPTLDDRPRLRNRGFELVEDAGQCYLLDHYRIAWPPLPLSRVEAAVVPMYDGTRSLRELRGELIKNQPQARELLHEQLFLHLAARLADHLYLDNEAFQNYFHGPVRKSSVFRDTTAPELNKQIASLFAGCGPVRPRCRAVLVPHMDYARGGAVYGHGFNALNIDATLFVIIATSHYSSQRFTLTRQNFQTPLGTALTDQAYIDRLVAHYGPGLFHDDLAHFPEHSVELEVAILQTMRANVRIVPLLVGSFQDCIDAGTSPRVQPDIAKMIAALKAAERESGERVAYIISGDLAHIGRKFDDPDLLNADVLAASAARDRAILDALPDAEACYRVIAAEGDRRRICGLPPTYVALSVLEPKAVEVLGYNQYVEERGTESVSYASVAFW